MSYVDSKELCYDAIRLLSSANEYEIRLFKAITEMSVSEEGDTSGNDGSNFKMSISR